MRDGMALAEVLLTRTKTLMAMPMAMPMSVGRVSDRPRADGDVTSTALAMPPLRILA